MESGLLNSIVITFLKVRKRERGRESNRNACYSTGTIDVLLESTFFLEKYGSEKDVLFKGLT